MQTSQIDDHRRALSRERQRRQVTLSDVERYQEREIIRLVLQKMWQWRRKNSTKRTVNLIKLMRKLMSRLSQAYRAAQYSANISQLYLGSMNFIIAMLYWGWKIRPWPKFSHCCRKAKWNRQWLQNLRKH